MIQIRQLQVSHDRLQDRLLLRIATPSGEEYRVWLTRHLLRELWPHLAKRAATPTAPDKPESTAGLGSFEQPFRNDPVRYPLGTTPLLINEVKCDRLTDGKTRLTFREGHERNIRITLSAELMQTFCAMLRAAAGTADWKLSLDYGDAEPATPPSAAAPTSSRLH